MALGTQVNYNLKMVNEAIKNAILRGEPSILLLMKSPEEWHEEKYIPYGLGGDMYSISRKLTNKPILCRIRPTLQIRQDMGIEFYDLYPDLSCIEYFGSYSWNSVMFKLPFSNEKMKSISVLLNI